MTAIIWKNGTLVVDSLAIQGREEIYDAMKVIVMTRTIVLKDGADIDDVALAYTYCGARWPAMMLMERLHHYSSISSHKSQTIKLVQRDYESAGALGLSVFENHFQALVIGNKANYMMTLPEEPGKASPLIVKVIPHETPVYLGAGERSMQNIDKQHGGMVNPVMAVYYAAAMEPDYVGGPLYEYRIMEEPKEDGTKRKIFGLYGIHSKPTPNEKAMAFASPIMERVPELRYCPVPDTSQFGRYYKPGTAPKIRHTRPRKKKEIQ